MKSNLAHKPPQPQGEVVLFPKQERQIMSDTDVSYSKTPNYLVDDNYVARMTGNALKCYTVINRFTEGFSRKNWAIASNFLSEKTGIKKNDTIYIAVKQLEEFGLLKVIRDTGETNKFTITHPSQQTVVVPINGSTDNGEGTTPDKRDKTTPDKRDTKKETFKENIKEREEEEERTNFQAQNRTLNFIEYHTQDRTPISFKNLCQKYSVEQNFVDQAKLSFPDHTEQQIQKVLSDLAQWSLSASNFMPQKWMSIWLDFMKREPTTKEQQAKSKKSTSVKPSRNVNDAWDSIPQFQGEVAPVEIPEDFV